MTSHASHSKISGNKERPRRNAPCFLSGRRGPTTPTRFKVGPRHFPEGAGILLALLISVALWSLILWFALWWITPQR